MALQWFCVPNHYNSFPLEIKECVMGTIIYWKKEGSITDDTQTLLGVLPQESIGLIGFGYGGLVAWNVALQAPHRVSRLILMGTIPEKKYIPKRLLFLLTYMPMPILLRWRGAWTLSRLQSILREFPQEEPMLPTLWLLAQDDPFHDWKDVVFPSWIYVQFDTYTTKSMKKSDDWRKKTKVFLEEKAELR